MSDDESLSQLLFGPIASRIRRKELPLIVVLGVAWWVASAWILYLVRLQMAVPDSQGLFGHNPFSEPARVLAGTVSGVIVMLWIAYLQVEDPGIPTGLTMKAAFKPVIFAAVFAFGASPIFVSTSGSVPYAVLVVATNCTTTLALSLLLRRVRQAG